MDDVEHYNVTVQIDSQERVLRVARGANLRRALLDAGLSPYGPLPSRVNCGGRGLCATCGVWIEDEEPPPHHWHDQLAARFGYPRLSCQIAVDRDLSIRLLTGKLLWGPRDPNRRYRQPSSRSRT